MRTLERWWTRAAIGAVAVLVALAAARWWVHGAVDRRSLAISVSRVAGGSAFLSAQSCDFRSGPGAWECWVIEPGGSGGDLFVVRMRTGSSCWTAARVFDGSEGDDLPTTASGCVRLWQWSPTDLL